MGSKLVAKSQLLASFWQARIPNSQKYIYLCLQPHLSEVREHLSPLTLLKSDPRRTVTELMMSTLTNSVVNFALKQRLKTLCTPAATLHDASEVKNCEPGAIQSSTELHAVTEVPENVRCHGESLLQTK